MNECLIFAYSFNRFSAAPGPGNSYLCGVIYKGSDFFRWPPFPVSYSEAYGCQQQEENIEDKVPVPAHPAEHPSAGTGYPVIEAENSTPNINGKCNHQDQGNAKSGKLRPVEEQHQRGCKFNFRQDIR